VIRKSRGRVRLESYLPTQNTPWDSISSHRWCEAPGEAESEKLRSLRALKQVLCYVQWTRCALFTESGDGDAVHSCRSHRRGRQTESTTLETLGCRCPVATLPTEADDKSAILRYYRARVGIAEG
jgi:hypothetical protein